MNARFFQLQWANFNNERNHTEELHSSPEFEELTALMRAEATEFLKLHGTSAAAAETKAEGPMFVWASIHGSGSCHPPHVHSDSAVTGTFYGCTPPGASPLVLDDPRGKTPYDIMVKIEQHLKHGTGEVDSGIPPFNQQISIPALEGQLVTFPPYLVHQVPPCDTAKGSWRVSFSFNLLGKWADSVATFRR